MSFDLKNLSTPHADNVPSIEGKGWKFGIVVSEYHAAITMKLLEGCKQTLLHQGASPNDIEVLFVPGAFELTYGAMLIADRHPDAIICLGCVIKGETDHDKYINHAVAQGITRLSLQINRPIIFGVLTPNNQKQAEQRAGGKYGNKGIEAAIAAIKMVALTKGYMPT